MCSLPGHWTEVLAEEMRKTLGLVSFATLLDADRLLDYQLSHGLELRQETGLDTRGEIRPITGGWKMKLSQGLDRDVRSDIIFHEIGHRYTRSGMGGVCLERFSWWWWRRDENNADLWAAHFRLPSPLIRSLVRRGAPWEDLVAECQAPIDLITLKLNSLGYGDHYPSFAGPAVSPAPKPELASRVFQIVLNPVSSWQTSVGVYKPATGEHWVRQYAQDRKRLMEVAEALAWDQMARSEASFWDRWHHLLQPATPPPGQVRWSNPKPERARSRKA